MPIIGNNSSGGKKPGTPTSVSASAGNASATVSFTEPAYEGKTGTATYVATSNPGSYTGTNTVSPITVSSLSNGTAYTFTHHLHLHLHLHLRLRHHHHHQLQLGTALVTKKNLVKHQGNIVTQVLLTIRSVVQLLLQFVLQAGILHIQLCLAKEGI